MATGRTAKQHAKRHLYNIKAWRQENFEVVCPNCNKRQTMQVAAVGQVIPCTCSHQMDFVFYSICTDPAELQQWFQQAAQDPKCEGVSYDYESNGNKTNDNDPWLCELVGCSFGRWDQPGVAIYVPLSHLLGTNMPMDDFKRVAAPFMEKANMAVHGAAIMEWPWTYVKLGVEPNIVCDTAIAAFMDDPNRKHRTDPRDLRLKSLAVELWDISVTEISDLIDLDTQHFGILPVNQAYEYGCQDSDLTTRLVNWGMKRLQADQGTIWRLEHENIQIASKMYLRGIKLDPQVLTEAAVILDQEIEQLEEDVFREMGYDIVKNDAGDWLRPFDLGSTAKVSKRLFTEMGIPPAGALGKSGHYSTSSDNLRDLRDDYPVIDKLLTWREAAHMRNNFVAPLPEYINRVTGFIHGNFNQTGAPTGRWSHSNPNLAQIPKLQD